MGCRTVYESSCTTKYVEKQPGKFVGDTGCEKLPVEICGAGCVFEEGPEECHDKTIASLVDVPEEQCDLNPQKTCRLQTKLVPQLAPKHECTIVPKETCLLKFSQPRQVPKPLQTLLTSVILADLGVEHSGKRDIENCCAKIFIYLFHQSFRNHLERILLCEGCTTS